MRRLFHLLRLTGFAALAVCGFVLLTAGAYAVVACVLMWLPLNAVADTHADAAAPTVEAYVLSNGVHTDLALPIANDVIDWRRVFPARDFVAPPSDAAFVAIGWGDREFYLNTPTWSDLSPRSAFLALFGNGPTLLHVTLLRRDQIGGEVFALQLSMPQYRALVRHVLESLANRADQARPGDQAVAIPNAHYGGQDAFYEASGHYGPLETCNTWTGRALANAGVAVSSWTPFDFNVTWHLKRVPQSLRPTLSGEAHSCGTRCPTTPLRTAS